MAVNMDQERSALLDLYQGARRAHFDSDAALFLAQNASRWYSVRNGTVTVRSKDLELPHVDRYLKSVRFTELLDAAPPTIHVSMDASMAWLIGEISARGLETQPDGTENEFAFRCSWVAVYEKGESGWAQVVNASTFDTDSA